MKKLLMVLCCSLMISPIAFARGPGSGTCDGTGGGGKGGMQQARFGNGNRFGGFQAKAKPTALRARFSAVAPYAGAAAGKADYRIQVQLRGRTRTRFTSNVAISLPDAALSMADTAAAEGSDIRLRILRTGSLVAECYLPFNVVRASPLDDQVLVAHFKVDLESRVVNSQSSLVARKGACDVDPMVGGIQAGVPAVAKGDVVQVVEINGDHELLFLSGTM